MADLGTLRVNLVANLKKFTADMKAGAAQVRNFADKVVSGMKRATRAVVDFALRAGRSLAAFASKWLKRASLAVAAFLGWSVKLAAAAQESESLMRESFEGMTEAAIAWSDDLQERLGLNAVELRKQAGFFNLMLESMGLTKDEAFDMSTTLTELAADMASFRDQSFEEMFEKIRSGIAGMSRPLKDIGVNIDDAVMKEFLLKEGIDRSTESMTQAEKVLLRYILILQQTQKDTGDLARTYDSTTNVFRVLWTQVKLLAQELGTELLPVVTSVGVAMRDWLIENREDIIEWFGTAVDKFEAFIDFLRADFQQGFTGSLEILTLIADAAMDAVVSVFRDHFINIGKKAITWIALGFKAAAEKIVQASENITDSIIKFILRSDPALIAKTFGEAEAPASRLSEIMATLKHDIAEVVKQTKEWRQENEENNEEIIQSGVTVEQMQQERINQIEQLKQKMRELAAAHNESENQIKAKTQETTSEWKRMWTDAAFTVKRVMQGASDGVTNAFVRGLENMAVEMDNFGDFAKQMLVEIMQEIARMEARLVAAKFLGSQESGGLGLSNLLSRGLGFLAGGLGGGAQALATGGVVKPVYAAKGFVSRGSDTVPAMLTPGEVVLPKDVAQSLGQQQAPPSVTFQIQTIDTQSMAQWVHQNRRMFAGAVSQAQAGNHPSRRVGNRQ
jgi:hypothetical protein